jgi:hypothetical protein
MPFGGRQPGAGRPLGARSRSTIERETMAELGRKLMRKSKRTPLEVILMRMDGDPTITDSMFAAAVAAAPYIHPRLAATEATIKSDNIHRVLSDQPLTAEEWLEKFRPPAIN